MLALPLMSRATEPSDLLATTASRAFDEKRIYDIPPQSLATALRLYSEFTGQAVMLDDTLTSGRRSPGVQGDFDATDALNHLLSGTGLVAKYSSNQAFTLKLADPGERRDRDTSQALKPVAGDETEAMTRQYAGTIQRPILAQLCQSGLTRPGTYRLALQIWITPAGKIQDIRLLSAPESVGQRERYIRAAFGHLKLDPPPAGLPQPITLLLLQDSGMLSTPCDAPVYSTH